MSLKDTEELKPVLRSCFWGHKWSMWQVVDLWCYPDYTEKSKISVVKQVRTCMNCNKKEVQNLN